MAMISKGEGEIYLIHQYPLNDWYDAGLAWMYHYLVDNTSNYINDWLQCFIHDLQTENSSNSYKIFIFIYMPQVRDHV